MRVEFYTTEINPANLQGTEELADWHTFKFIRDTLARNIHLKLGFRRKITKMESANYIMRQKLDVVEKVETIFYRS